MNVNFKTCLTFQVCAQHPPFARADSPLHRWAQQLALQTKISKTRTKKYSILVQKSQSKMQEAQQHNLIFRSALLHIDENTSPRSQTFAASLTEFRVDRMGFWPTFTENNTSMHIDRMTIDLIFSVNVHLAGGLTKYPFANWRKYQPKISNIRLPKFHVVISILSPKAEPWSHLVEGDEGLNRPKL